MDSSNRQKSPLPEQPPAAIAGGDWRSQLTKESRRRILIKIINTLKTCLPFSGQEGLQELQKIAMRFEEMSFTAATDQYDYLKRISSKLNSVESRPSGNTNAVPSNSAGMDRNPQDPAIQNVQSQVQNQGQSLPIPMTSIQKSAVQGVDSDHANSERQNIQHVSPQQQIHRSQNPQEYIYPQQLRQPLLKKDLHKGVTKQPLTQPQMQSSPLSVVQSLPTMQPSIAPVLQQSQPSSAQRQDQQSVLETQVHEYSQQATVHHQTQMFQQPMLQSQQHDQQQQNLMGQHTSISDMQLQQSQRSLGQKNNILIMHQQRLASRSHVGQLPQQQQLREGQSGTSSIQINQHLEQIMQQPNFSLQQQCLNVSTLLSGDGQQQSQQQERMLHMPSQMAQVQQQFVSQKQPNFVGSNMQQKIITSNPFLLQQNDQQKTFQSQRLPAEAPSTLLESTAHNGISSDWREEVYQKINVLKEMYFAELSEAHQKICFKLQQLVSLSQHTKTVEKLKYYKKVVESLLHYLQVPKNNIQQYHMDKLASLDKYILKVLGALGARKPGSPMLQRQLPSTHLQSMQKTEQPEEQILQIGSHDGVINSQLQALNAQGSSAIISSQQKLINPSQSGSNEGLGQDSTPTSIQQNPLSTSQLASTSDSAPQIGMTLVNSNISSLQPVSSMLQSQHMKEQNGQQIMQQRRQIKEPFQQHRIHQQLQQTTQKQQQQQHMQQVKQQHGQLQQMDIKPRPFVQNLSEGKKYPHQQLKPGFSFPNSSLQSPQASSPPIKQQSSLSVVPSSTPLAPSPIPVDPEKHSTMASSVSNATSIIHQQTTLASPLLEELSPSDSHGNTLNSPGKSSITQQPLERLLKVVKSMSSKTLNASVSDIGSVVSMIDRIGGPAPGEGSRAAVEDLAAVTNYHLQARNWMAHDGSIGMKRMRECTNIFALNATSSVGSPTDSFELLPRSDLDFSATTCVKRPRIEINPALLEEIRKINECLIDTVVDMCDKFASEGGEGTFVKCCYNAMTLSPNLKLYYASEKVLPIQPIRLLVPVNYPNCSPILLDKFPAAFSKEYNDLSSKAYSRFSIALRTVSQPMSLMEIARTWDDCARSVMCDYASLLGGGTFSSKFGTLDKCLSVA